MDLLDKGRKIRLPEGATLTIGYFGSCLREKITGGEVIIGSDKSSVIGGKREAETVDCNGGPRVVPAKRGAETAGAVFRKGESPRKKYPKPDWTLYGTQPVLLFSQQVDRVRIERLDREDEKSIDLAISGRSIDTGKAGVLLDPGGLYALTSGSNIYILKVSPLAVPNVPLLSRLVPM